MNIKDINNLKRVEAFHGDFAVYDTTDGKAGLINRKGEIILPAYKCESITHCQDDIFELWTEKEERTISITAYFDAKMQKEVAKPEFEYTPVPELPAFAKKYDCARWCAKNRIAFKEGELFGILDEKGNVVVPPSFKEIQLYIDDHIRVRNQEGKCGILDVDGNVFIPFEYSFIVHHRKLGVYSIHTLDDKWGYLNEKGEILIPAIYDSIDAHGSRGLDEIAVKKDGRCYFINVKQEEVKVF